MTTHGPTVSTEAGKIQTLDGDVAVSWKFVINKTNVTGAAYFGSLGIQMMTPPD